MKIPAIPFMLKVRDYAHANKLPFFKWEDQNRAAKEYLKQALINVIG
jgi:hypothetical protein